ncbi:MAG: hypothetical protein U5L96_00155 [Owenweeksia sp.]|nr:hypothetical protein [Owenweeksia sp.]
MELALMPRQRKSEFKIYLREGAIESFTGLANDSLSYTINSLKGEELGSLYFKVETDSSAPLRADHQQF